MEIASSVWFPLTSGAAIGAVMGFVARYQYICSMSALERHWYAADSSGLRTWGLAAAVALLCTQLLFFAGLVDLKSSFYLNAQFPWSGAVLGGLMFGAGMALVGTCAFGALVRLGGGSLRSLVVLLIIGLSALAAQRGLIGLGRVHIVENLALDLGFAGDQSLGSLISALVGQDVRFAVATFMVMALFWWVFRDPTFRQRRGLLAGGTAIGLCIAAGWFVTTLIAHHSFAPTAIRSASFVAPVGDALMQITFVTGEAPNFAVGLVLGVLLGAAGAAIYRRDVRWEACDDARELSRHLLGGLLMGVGGVFALGCTVGQGITALSALALSAPLVIASIAVGARLGLIFLIEGPRLPSLRLPVSR